MEQILKHFGQGIRAGLIAVLLFALFFGKDQTEENGGILKEVSRKTADEIQETDYRLYGDYKNLQIEAEKPEPVLTETFSSKKILINENIVWQDEIKAEDCNGKIYPVFLKKVVDAQGNILPLEEIEKEPGVLCFEEPGVYHLVVMVKSDAGKKKYYEIMLLIRQNE
ncbi:MAG: hypothetical protein SO160_06295 [Lachnospiraceae bacterium]|nr:hypothetical protein [Lachnospiraceae bacterium]